MVVSSSLVIEAGHRRRSSHSRQAEEVGKACLLTGGQSATVSAVGHSIVGSNVNMGNGTIVAVRSIDKRGVG